MMKKNFYFLLMAALVCGLSVTSCKDDDKNDNNGGTDTGMVEDGISEEDAQAWSWVSIMTDETTQETGWQNKSYDVTIGQQSDNDQSARLIIVSNLDDAKANFSTIAGCAPEELNTTKTVSAGSYGSMTWNISEPSAPNIATVEVKSPLLKTTKLIYCTEEQSPDNASNITGNCYYRLGDVIEDPDGFYWVCVQPSFLGKKFNDSYWVNIFNAAESGRGVNTKKLPGIPSKFICSKYNKNKKYNNNTILLPTGLKENRQQTFNFCNLLWALLNTNYFFNEVVGYGFNVVAGLPAKYHGRTYFRLLGEKWDKYGIYEKIFNHSKKELERMDRVYFFYNGYHWKTGTTAGVWIYESTGPKLNYTGSVKDDDTLFEMVKAGYGFDVRRYASDPLQDKDCASTGKDGMPPAKQFNNQNDKNVWGIWVMRVATGKQLDKKYNHYKPMNKMSNICNFNETKFNVIYKTGEKATPVTDEQLAQDEELYKKDEDEEE
jgi:hypothetical protein